VRTYYHSIIRLKGLKANDEVSILDVFDSAILKNDAQKHIKTFKIE